VTRDEYLATLRREGEALLVAAQAAPGARIASCPDWDMADLVWHIGEVHRFWGTVADRHLTDPGEYEVPDRPADDELVDWARTALDYVEGALARTDPSTPVWTWSAQRDVAFIVRRMAQETAVHRWDAEQAAGIEATIEPELASDGIDEYLSLFIGRREGEPASVHVHATDTPGEWLIAFGDGDPVLRREHAKGDAAMRGPAAGLLLALWQRLPLDAVEVVGDPAAIDRLFAVAMRG
jgi:uncharacterized protein (TIGR03083 family)